MADIQFLPAPAAPPPAAHCGNRGMTGVRDQARSDSRRTAPVSRASSRPRPSPAPPHRRRCGLDDRCAGPWPPRRHAPDPEMKSATRMPDPASRWQDARSLLALRDVEAASVVSSVRSPDQDTSRIVASAIVEHFGRRCDLRFIRVASAAGCHTSRSWILAPVFAQVQRDAVRHPHCSATSAASSGSGARPPRACLSVAT